MPHRDTKVYARGCRSVTPVGGSAVFLDRDGVLNRLVQRDGRGVSPRSLGEFKLVRGARTHVERLRDSGCRVFVVTNQPDIARGFLAPETLASMMEALRREIPIDDLAVCPHDDGSACDCRKPAPGLLLGLAERWAVDLERSFIIGDSWRDIEAGRRAGCRTVLVQRGRYGGLAPDCRVRSLGEAADFVLTFLQERVSRCE